MNTHLLLFQNLLIFRRNFRSSTQSKLKCSTPFTTLMTTSMLELPLVSFFPSPSSSLPSSPPPFVILTRPPLSYFFLFSSFSSFHPSLSSFSLFFSPFLFPFSFPNPFPPFPPFPNLHFSSPLPNPYFPSPPFPNPLPSRFR